MKRQRGFLRFFSLALAAMLLSLAAARAAPMRAQAKTITETVYHYDRVAPKAGYPDPAYTGYKERVHHLSGIDDYYKMLPPFLDELDGNQMKSEVRDQYGYLSIYVIWGYDPDTEKWIYTMFDSNKEGYINLNGYDKDYPSQFKVETGSNSIFSTLNGPYLNNQSIYVVYAEEKTYTVSPEEGLSPHDPAHDSVSIDVQAYSGEATVYSVDVEWGAMTFQYNESLWDPATLTASAAKWLIYDSDAGEPLAGDVTQDAVNAVKVSNRSNAPVNARFEYIPGDTGVSGTITNDESEGQSASYDESSHTAILLSAQETGTAPYVTNYFMPSGAPADSLPGFDGKWKNIGNIKVTVSPAD